MRLWHTVPGCNTKVAAAQIPHGLTIGRFPSSAIRVVPALQTLNTFINHPQPYYGHYHPSRLHEPPLQLPLPLPLPTTPFLYFLNAMPKLLSVYKRPWESFRPWAIPWKPLPKTALQTAPKQDDDKNLVTNDLPEVRPLDLLIVYHPDRQLDKEVASARVSSQSPSPSPSPSPSRSPEPPQHNGNNQNKKNESPWRRHRILVLAIAIILAGATISGAIVAGFIATRPQQNQVVQGGDGDGDNDQYIYPGLSTLPLIVTRTIRGTATTRTLTKTRTRTQTPRARSTSAGFDVVVTTPALGVGIEGGSVVPVETAIV
ncbi:hypothetical protein QBC40DRAFT_350315 [Triangularia verruculosa]|uniref:Uncharacterized protein n=1 Tax=Triangularia verruculosa TaxID=2587418 RepID=A0AAN6XEZ1_9PEZI|nr:hypothetical protein QBC40DRAFT_350315 [Triangularia verruculosa]